MDAVTATLLGQATRDISRARRDIVDHMNGGHADLPKLAVETLGEALTTLRAVEQRMIEGKV